MHSVCVGGVAKGKWDGYTVRLILQHVPPRHKVSVQRHKDKVIVGMTLSNIYCQYVLLWDWIADIEV